MASPETAVAPGEAPITYTERPVLCPPTPELARGQLHLRTLGAAEVHVGEGAIIGPSSERLFSMLVVCALEPDHVISRTQLLALVWPDMDDAAARHSLRQHTYRLRKMGIGIGIDSTRAAVVLDRASILPSFAVDRTSALFQRDVLHGQEPFGHLCAGWVPTLSTLRQWLERQRELYHAEVRRVLVPELRMLRDRGQWEDCERWSRTVLEFDSFNEDATLILAEAIAMLGSRARATELLESYVRETGSAGTPLGRRVEQAQQRIMRAGRVSYDGSARTKLVGRNDELARLDALTQQAMQGHAQMVRITGPAGIGKTELSYEATRRAVILGFGRCLVRVSRTMGQVAHGTLSRMVRDLLNLPGSLGCRPANLRLLRQFAGVEPTSNWELSDELSTPSPLTECLLELITSIAEERPLFILVDDLHYVDRQSLEEIERLFDLLQRQQVVFVVTERGVDEDGVAVETLPMMSRVSDFELLGLQLADRELLASIVSSISGRTLNSEVASRIARSGVDTPMEVIALAKEALAAGLTHNSSAQLRATLQRQFNRMSDASRTLLAVVSLLGGKASITELDTVVELGIVDRTRAMRSAVDAGLVEATTQEAVCHDEVSDTLKQLFAEPELELIRRHTVDRLRLMLRSNFVSERAIDVLALASECSDAVLFVDAVLELAPEIAGAGLFRGALRFVEVAARQAPDSSRKARVLECLVQIANAAAAWHTVLSGTQRLRDLSPGGRPLTPELSLSVLEAELQTDLRVAGRQKIEQAMLWIHSMPLSTDEQIRALRLVIAASSDLFEADLAVAAFSTLSDSTMPISERPLLGLEPQMQFHTVFGDLSAARLLADRVYESRGALLGDFDGLRLLQNASHVFRLCGHIARSRELMELLLEQPALRESSVLRGYAFWRLSLIEIDDGNFDAAIDWSRRLLDLSASSSELATSDWATLHGLRVEILESGKLIDAERALSYALHSTESPTRAQVYATALALHWTGLATDPALRSKLLRRSLRYLTDYGRFSGHDLLALSIAQCADSVGVFDLVRNPLEAYFCRDRREKSIVQVGAFRFSHETEKQLRLMIASAQHDVHEISSNVTQTTRL